VVFAASTTSVWLAAEEFIRPSLHSFAMGEGNAA
jgi:hypothetical protein